MKFNDYINLVGIEFEGLYTLEFKKICQMEALTGDLIKDMHNDGSVNRRSQDEYDRELIPVEVVTKPLNAEQLDRVLELFGGKFKSRDYCLNQTTGLHFHVSLKKAYYAYIDNQEFYNEFVEMFKLSCPRVFNERKEISYCKIDPDDNPYEHFTLSSRDRYAMVNYCYRKHGTVEFRAYGGSHATIVELGQLIQRTIDLIGGFIDKKEAKMLSLCQKIEHESEDKMAKTIGYKIEPNKPKNIYLNIPKPEKENPNYNFKTTSLVRELNVDISY